MRVRLMWMCRMRGMCEMCMVLLLHVQYTFRDRGTPPSLRWEAHSSQAVLSILLWDPRSARQNKREGPYVRISIDRMDRNLLVNHRM